MKIFLHGIEVTEHLDFFTGFNWQNFDAGDRVYVGNCKAAIFDGFEFVWFEMATANNVFLARPEI